MSARMAAAVLILALSACSTTPTSASPSASPAGPSASAASSSPENTPTATPLQELTISWSQADFDTLVGAVAADQGQFVAVSGNPRVRIAWTSGNGTDWTEHPVPEPVGCNELPNGTCIERTAGMGPMARLGDTLYSIGTTTSFNDFLQPIGWRWTDGQAWQAISSQSEFYAFGRVVDLAASEDALVAARLGEALGPFGSIIWRWTSEMSWVASNVSARRDPVDVYDTTWGSGVFMAVGAVPQATAEFEVEPAPAAWVSDDGLDWRAVGRPPTSTRLCSVTSTSFGFIVIGWSDDGPMAWVSQDGTGWSSRGTLLEGSSGGTTDLVLYGGCAVVEVAGGLLATLATERGTLTWTSVDGMEWTAGETLDILATAQEVAGLDNTVAVAGYESARFRRDGSIKPVLMIGVVNP